jgi:signal transduction histidine kinase
MTGRLEGNINEMMDTMRRQEEFMGGLAHELKTPLTSIIGYADLLRGHTLSDRDQRDAANYIFMEGRRLEVLSLKLLELIVMKKRDFDFVPVAVGEIVDDAARMLIPVLEKRGVRLTYSCDASVCLLEPDLFMSLLLNIVDNARKAIDGEGRIAIRSKNDGENCFLSISDNGRGIPEEELYKIRDAFYRVDKSRSRAQGGVGLGLRLCDEIAAVHNGKISFESKPGRGTTVTVTLKLESTAGKAAAERVSFGAAAAGLNAAGEASAERSIPSAASAEHSAAGEAAAEHSAGKGASYE